MRLLHAIAADIGSVNEAGAIGRKFGNTDIELSAAENALDSAGIHRVTGAKHDATPVKVAGAIISGGKAPVIGAGARNGGKNIYRVYHQVVSGVILAGYFEAQLVAVKPVRNFYGYPLVVNVLIGKRELFYDISHGSMHV